MAVHWYLRDPVQTAGRDDRPGDNDRAGAQARDEPGAAD
jgi:hypothetical protein